MINYEDLPEDIKAMYSKEQCEQLIILAEKASLWVADFMEALRKIIQAIQPALKKIKKLLEQTEAKETLPQSNHKYLSYKPKIKQILVYKKIIYYHIRSNC